MNKQIVTLINIVKILQFYYTYTYYNIYFNNVKFYYLINFKSKRKCKSIIQ